MNIQKFSNMLICFHISVYNNDRKDRLWGVSCKAFKQTRMCRWSKLVNDYLGNVDFRCGDDRVIAGVYSRHSGLMRDRR